MPKPPNPFKSLYKDGGKMARTKTEEFNQIKYQNEFNKANYDRVEVNMPKGKKAVVKETAKAAGQSVSKYINQAIDERMERDRGSEAAQKG